MLQVSPHVGENCPVVTSTTEDSSMSLAEQSDATVESAAPVQPESSVKTQPSTESQQTSSPIQEEAEEGDSSTEDGYGSDSDSGSSSESDNENGPELESKSAPDAPSDSSLDLPSRENLSAVQGAQVNQGQDSQKPRTASPLKGNQTEKKTTPTNSAETEKQDVKPKKPLNSLKDFPFDPIYWSWYDREKESNNIFRTTIADLGLKGDKVNLKQLVDILGIAADIIRELHRGEEEFYKNLHKHYNSYFRNTPIDQRPTIETFDNYLYSWAKKVWPHALDIIRERCRR